MKVLVVTSELPPVMSGVARSVARVVQGLAARGHEVDTLSGVDGHTLTLGEFRFHTMSRRWIRLRRAIGDYDVVNLHGPFPLISDLLLARLGLTRRRPSPVVYTHHFSVAVNGLEWAYRPYNRVHEWLARSADRVIVTSESYREIMHRSGGRPVEVVPWGFDRERFELEPPARYDGSRPLRVLFVGQMRPYKGVADLIDAVADQPQLAATLVGSGAREDDYRERAERVANVDFVGEVSDGDLPALFVDHDVVALPSTNVLEAFGLVLIEGMAAGCVPVASDLPGVRDTVADNGRLVEPGEPADLRRVLLELASDPAGVAELQERAPRRAGSYNWETTVDSYEKILSEEAARSGPREGRR